MTRKLVTIRKVLDIQPIEGADKIEVCIVGGWNCVTRKGEFKVGDLGLYFEIDSFLPEEEPFTFLRGAKTMHTGEKGYRLRTMRLRGQLSQGLLLPLSMFSNIDFSDTKKDYSEDLKVILWEPKPNPQLAGLIKGNFPIHIIPKTDQERIQNLSNWFDKYKNVEFEETEKLDGMSVTIYKHDEHIGVCSRNLELKEDENNQLWKIAYKYDLKNKLYNYNGNIAIQGELVGPGIQGNPLKLKEVDYYVYDIWDIDEQRYLASEERVDICKVFNLKHVPKLGNSDILNHGMKFCLEYVKGYSIFGDMPREGIVFKSTKPVNGKIISFKGINNDFLLRKK